MDTQYIVDQYDTVYELKNGTYFFVGKLNGRTFGEFLEDLAIEMDNMCGDCNFCDN